MANSDEALASGDLLRERLMQTFLAPNYRPPALPAVAVELLQLSSKSDVSFRAVRKVMEQDPLVAGRVLLVAQSAAYSATPVRTLEDALVRIGLRTLADLFLDAAMNLRVFRAEGYEVPMRALARHSSAVAHVARHVARRTSIYDEYAFLCGLLHDVGAGAGMIALAERPGGSHNIPFEVAWPAVLDAHEVAVGHICRAWKLPPEIALVVENHHLCFVSKHTHPVSAVVHVADWITGELGLSPEPRSGAPLSTALGCIGLDAEALPALVKEAEELLKKIPP